MNLARRERIQLCDLALEVGSDAPTLCDGWNVKDLITHLLVREGHPLAAAGILIPPLAGFTTRTNEFYRHQELATMVAKLRRPRWAPGAIPQVDAVINTAEFFVHHEDILRAQDDWQPRALSWKDQRTLWKALAKGGRLLLRKTDLPLVLTSDFGSYTMHEGEHPVVLKGDPGELVLRVFGRRAVDVEVSGPTDRIAQFEALTLGV